MYNFPLNNNNNSLLGKRVQPTQALWEEVRADDHHDEVTSQLLDDLVQGHEGSDDDSVMAPPQPVAVNA